MTSEIESMDPQFPFAGGKANSLVFSFTAELCPEHALDGPEADYLKWIGKALFADVGTAADEAEWDKSTPEEREAWRLFHTAIEATRKKRRSVTLPIKQITCLRYSYNIIHFY